MRSWIKNASQRQKNIFILFLIIALGLFLRIWHIDNTPPGIYTDEAVNGLDAIGALHGDWQWFYVANNGREGLFVNLIALCFKFFGVSGFTLRLPAILFGTLTILGVYLLAGELFERRRIGLISAFLTAVSFWSINFSRISFRAILLPAVLTFSFYFFWRGIRTKKWYDFAASGLIFGLGMHTYIAFRIAPLIIVIALVAFVITRKYFFREYRFSLFIFVLSFAFSAAPMLHLFFVTHPEYLVSRTTDISLFNPAVNQGHFWELFFRTFGLALVKYNFIGDQNWRHNFPPYGLLDQFTGLAFLFGLIYFLIKVGRCSLSRCIKDPHNRKFEISIFLVSWFFVMLVPEVIAVEKNPHALRSIGTLPVVFIFAAFAFDYLWKKSESVGAGQRRIIPKVVLLALIFIGFFNPIKYFFFWAKHPQVARAFNQELVDMEQYIRALPADKEVFVFTDDERRKTLRFSLLERANVHYLNPLDTEVMRPENEANFEIIYTDYKRKELEKNIKAAFPTFQVQKRTGVAGISFFITKRNE